MTDKLKFERSFIIALSDIVDRELEDTGEIYDDLEDTINAIPDPYTRGYMVGYMERLNEQGFAADEILEMILRFSRRIAIRDKIESSPMHKGVK